MPFLVVVCFFFDTACNESKTQHYTALSPSCKITNLGRIIVETFVPFSQGYCIGSSESKTEGSYNRYSTAAKIVEGQCMKFTTNLNLPYNAIQIIQCRLINK